MKLDFRRFLDAFKYSLKMTKKYFHERKYNIIGQSFPQNTNQQ